MEGGKRKLREPRQKSFYGLFCVRRLVLPITLMDVIKKQKKGKLLAASPLLSLLQMVVLRYPCYQINLKPSCMVRLPPLNGWTVEEAVRSGVHMGIGSRQRIRVCGLVEGAVVGRQADAETPVIEGVIGIHAELQRKSLHEFGVLQRDMFRSSGQECGQYFSRR